MGPRVLVPLLVTTFLHETLISLCRITISYRALEMGVSPLTFGGINAAYALFPIFFALSIGRIVDRNHEIGVSRISGALSVLTSVGLLMATGPIALTLFTATLGLSFLSQTVVLQVICARISSAESFPYVIANYLVAGAIGQAAGAYLIAAIGGDSPIPATYPIFLIGLCISLLAFLSTWILRSRPKGLSISLEEKRVPISQIFRLPGFKLFIAASVVCVASVDIILIYLPALGVERGFSAEFVGTLLMLRSIASLIARLLYTRLIMLVGSYALMTASASLSAFSSLGFALPLPAWTFYVVAVVLGFSLSICLTTTMTKSLELATDDIRGTVSSVRLIGNRVGQLVFPALASVLAALVGVASIFAVTGAALALSASALHKGRPR